MISSALHLLARAAPTLPEGVDTSQPLESPYGYIPSLASTVAYLTVFSLLTLVHLGLGIRYKYYSAIVTMVVGGLLEVIGWAGRLWSHKNILNWDPFIMQICCLILGPVFFSAWDYTILGYCIKVLGPQYSLLGPKWYLIVFIIADVVSLVLQAIGGGGAAVQAQRYEDTTTNTNIMLAGILFQLGTTTIFVVLAIDFMVRVVLRKPYPASVQNCWGIRLRKKKTPAPAPATETVPGSPHSDTTAARDTEHDAEGQHEKSASATNAETSRVWLRRSQILLLGVAWASLMIYIRGIYRSIELAQGWTGHLMTHEVYFIWLDGFMMVLCMAGLAVAHPGFLLPPTGWS